jgi:prepilin-type processing-associated H-X9-DG protein
MKRHRVTVVDIITCTVIVVILAAVLMPVYGGPKTAKTSGCLSNLKQQYTGLLIYSQDQNDLLPPGPQWMDDLGPYIKNEQVLHCTMVPKSKFGYALNKKLGGGHAAKIPAPETTLLVFDADRPDRNGLAPANALPNPGRHFGRNNVCYADGHAKRLPLPDAK